MKVFYTAFFFFSVFIVFCSRPALSEPNMSGQTGLIFMPDSRLEEDGVLRFGASNADPYFILWSSITLLPRLEMSGRFTTIDGAPAFGGGDDYRDKAFDAKLLLWRESNYLPAITVGAQDFLGTRVFDAKFVAINKQFFDLDLTVGYGRGRIDGLWGGLRYRPSWSKKFNFVLEYDVNDYQGDVGSSNSGAFNREGGATYALEYRHGWYGAQLAYQNGDAAVNAFISIPLMVKEFIPKIDEPTAYTKKIPQPPLHEWQADLVGERALLRELHHQGFKNISLAVDETSIEASLTHPRISLIGRLVGRAARTMLLLTPSNVESIKITYTDSVNGLPLLTYHFQDTDLLQEYFDGLISLPHLETSINVEYASAEYLNRVDDRAISISEFDAPVDENMALLNSSYGEEGHIVSFRNEDQFLSSFHFIPFNLRIFFNDPSSAYHYDIFSLVKYNRRIGSNLFFNAAARATILEDVSEVSQPSDSLLPHVRSDVAEYKQGDRFRLDTLLINKYFHPRERFYGRLSIGYYEEMFAGTGGQLLYLPKKSQWALDLTVDWLKQRESQGGIGFRDYATVSALGAVHYRFPFFGLSATARAGRFLAKDEGVRFELNRRFRSGVKIGAWYTRTNGNDITGPGSLGSPYQDKGVFASIPLSSMLTWDTRATAKLSLAPWARDVGQIVMSPGDLFPMIERSSMWKEGEYSPLTELAE